MCSLTGHGCLGVKTDDMSGIKLEWAAFFSCFAIEWNCVCWLKGNLSISYSLFQPQQQCPVWVPMVSIHVQSRQDCWQVRGDCDTVQKVWALDRLSDQNLHAFDLPTAYLAYYAFSIENLPIWVSQCAHQVVLSIWKTSANYWAFALEYLLLGDLRDAQNFLVED